MFIVLAGGLLIVIVVAVVAAGVSPVCSSVAGETDPQE